MDSYPMDGCPLLLPPSPSSLSDSIINLSTSPYKDLPIRLSKFMMDQALLNQLLAYRNENVIARFMDLYEVNELEAEDIFNETKKFLFLSQKFNVFIPDDLLIIDEMWHNFILFTPDYQHFCQEYFQRFLHHVPATKQEKEQRKAARLTHPEQTQQEYLERLAELMGAAYDHLGDETVVKWFEWYPEKYSKENIKTLRK